MAASTVLWCLLLFVCQIFADRTGSALLKEVMETTNDVKGKWDLNPKELLSLTDALIAFNNKTSNVVAASVRKPSWKATMQPFVDADPIGTVAGSMITLPSSLSPNKALRDASNKASEKLSAFGIESSFREDVYKAIAAFNKTSEAAALTGEQKRYLEKTMLGYKRVGLTLPAAKRNQLMALRKRMTELSIKFSECLAESIVTRSFTKAELQGMSADYIAGLKPDKQAPGKLIVTTKYPDYYPLMRNCKVESTRKTMILAFASECHPVNTARLDELVKLRQQEASILGYPNHAAYALEENMAKNPTNVINFLTDLSNKLTPLQKKDMQELLQAKKADKAALKQPFDGKINDWDAAYYTNMVTQQKYSVDEQKVQQYFPVEIVTNGLFKIYENMLGLRYVFDAALSKNTWHPDVKAYKVFDAKTQQLVGIFYMDLHPRPGKYGHAAMFPLQPGSFFPGSGTKRTGGRSVPVGALVCNFPKPNGNQAATLPHSDVVTYFHEFGHVMHKLCGHTNLSLFEGTNVQTDFVEAPSQMLENWCWETDVLQKMSGHVNNTKQPIPKELAVQLAKSQLANAGMSNKRQIALATFDQYVHTRSNVSTAAVYRSVATSVVGIPPAPGTNFPARFEHLAGGYDAQYYSYLWSKVFAQDMYYSKFKKNGIFNPQTGMDYRNKILRPGGSKDASVLLLDFLGRPPNNAAFLKSIGLDADTKKPKSTFAARLRSGE